MKTIQLSKNLYYVGVVDHNLKVFDSIMPLTYGTSYNSYLLKTEAGAVLFEGSKHGFEEEYLSNIASIVPPSEIRYLVVAHTEPDHSGAIEALLKANPEIIVIASPSGISNLKNILRFPFRSQVVTPGKEMKVGSFTLRFLSGLYLHWPDVLFTEIVEEKAIVTCDAFGAHYAFDEILYSKLQDEKEYRAAFDYYFACIMGPYASYVLEAVKRVRALSPSMLLVGHGPVIDKNAAKVIDAFEEEAKKYLTSYDENHVTLVYTTCYGYTEKMARILRDGLERSGKNVDFYAIDALNYAKKKEEILKSISGSKLVLFGSPTVNNDAISYFYDLFLAKPVTFYQNRKFSAFGDFGWSGEAVKNLSDFALSRKMKVIDGFRYAFKIDERGAQELQNYLTTLL